MLKIVLCLFMILTSSTYAQMALSTQLQAALDAVVASPETNFPGAILYVSHPEGTWLGAAGVADIETAAPLSPNASFRAGSIMKPFVAVTILQLVEEGKLSLNTSLYLTRSQTAFYRSAESAR